MAKVEVRPIERNKWHGLKGEQSFTRPKTLEVLPNFRTKRYATGLTKEEEKEYSELLGVDLSDTYMEGKPHPYWSSKPAWIVLENKTQIFDTEIPSEFVKIKNMKASDMVANSLSEYEEGLYPEATHYIYDESEKLEKEATKVEKKRKAFTAFSKLTKQQKIGIIHLLGTKNSSASDKSNAFIDGSIGEIIETKLDQFLNYATMPKDELFVRGIVKEAEFKGVLIKEGTAYNYMGDRIGNDFEETVAYLSNDKNQQLKAVIIEKLNS